MILVTGGTGTIGSRLVKELVKGKNKVRVLTLPNDPKTSVLEDIDCEIVYGDITDSQTIKNICKGVKTVYHLAAIIISYKTDEIVDINIEGTRNLVTKSLNAGVNHFIYVSSVSAVWPEGSEYAYSKKTAESIVKSQNKMASTIVRPTLIYGCDEGQEFMMFLKYLKMYPIVFFIGRGKARKKPILADDVVTGLTKIVNNPRTYGKTYNFSGSEEITIWNLAKLMLKHQGLSKQFIAVPVPICKFIAAIMERGMKEPPLTNYAISRILQDAAPDNSAVKEDLDFNPIGITKGMDICYPISKTNR
jgi:nucleoside-diphosphate-sugar epimerase